MTDKNRQKGNESVGEKSDGLAGDACEAWSLSDPMGNVVATESTCVKAWARIDGYKPTVEALLGYEQQGWRVVPVRAAPEALGAGEGGVERSGDSGKVDWSTWLCNHCPELEVVQSILAKAKGEQA